MSPSLATTWWADAALLCTVVFLICGSYAQGEQMHFIACWCVNWISLLFKDMPRVNVFRAPILLPTKNAENRPGEILISRCRFCFWLKHNIENIHKNYTKKQQNKIKLYLCKCAFRHNADLTPPLNLYVDFVTTLIKKLE